MVHAVLLVRGRSSTATRLVQESAVQISSRLRSARCPASLTLDDDVELRVVDSTADIRYLVVPRRPSGTDSLDEEALAALVTRDSMIGVSQPLGDARAPCSPGRLRVREVGGSFDRPAREVLHRELVPKLSSHHGRR